VSLIADGWYTWITDLPALSDWLTRRPRPFALAARVGPLRGLLLHALSVRRDRVAVMHDGPGWRSLLLARALLGRRRKLVVFHYIDLPGRDRWRALERWALRRALAAAQALTPEEAERYAARLGVGPERIRYLPFAWRTAEGDLPPGGERRGVISAGRAFCDWETLFAAAEGADWALTVVCSRADRRRVEGLNADGRATVLTDVPDGEMPGLLGGAAVCVIAMRDSGVSQGQVRLCQAVDSGTAVVATDVAALRAYVEPGRTAVLVPPGDPGGLRAQVDGLLADDARREALSRAAWERAAGWGGRAYLEAVTALAREAAG
jgi:glycosyltransferase involved in cell wall biosynthesis